MSAPVIIPFAKNEKPTAERMNAIISALKNKFGTLDGSDMLWPLVLSGDMDLNGNRMLRTREMMSVLNMEEFGTDESAFAQAIGELTGGGVIFIPRNTTITLSRSIKVSSNRQRIYIIGSGHSSQIKMADSADDPAIVFDGCRFCRVSNLFINGNGSNNQTGSGIDASNSSEFEISNVWVGSTSSAEGPAGPGIKATNCRDFAIKRSWIRNSSGPGIQVIDGSRNFDLDQLTISDASDAEDFDGDGIYLRRASEGRVHGCQVQNVSGAGVRMSECQNTRLYANAIRADSNDNDGVVVTGESDLNISRGIVVNANQIQGFATGIRIGAFVEGAVLSNQVQLNDLPMVYDGAELSRIISRNNMAFFAASHGLATIPSGSQNVDIDLGKSHLPIQSIHATWKYSSSVTLIRNSVPAAAYGIAGPSILTISIAHTVPFQADLYYSVFI